MALQISEEMCRNDKEQVRSLWFKHAEKHYQKKINHCQQKYEAEKAMAGKPI